MKGKALFLIDINFEIERGESVAFVGESGSGKSLTAKSLVKFIPEDFNVEGKIFYKGKNILELKEEELINLRGNEVYYLTQNPYEAFDKTFKIEYQLKEYVESKGKEFNKNLFYEYLFDFGLDESVRKMYPFELSGGMLQRLSIIKAIMIKPQVLIADEPTTGLDEENRRKIVEMLKTISHKENLSVIFISHDIEMIKLFSPKKVLVFYSGTIVEETKRFFEKRFHPYSIDLFNASPINWKKGKPINVREGFIPLPDKREEKCFYYSRCLKRIERCKKGFPQLKDLDEERVRCFLYFN